MFYNSPGLAVAVEHAFCRPLPLRRAKRSDAQEINESLWGNICRYGTYHVEIS